MRTESTPRVLLIEDNPADARYIREMLREAREFSERMFDGGETAAASGEPRDDTGLVHETRLEAGLERLDDDEFDVVLLDLNLPDSEGLDTLRSLREATGLIPVVVLTGLRDREIGVDALREGADEYLVKDEINPDLLVRSVYHSIERKTHEREQKRYETLIEEATDVNAIVEEDGTIRYNTPSTTYVLGYEPDELHGVNAFELIHPDDREEAWEEFAGMVEDPDYRAQSEFRFEHADGHWVDLHARGRNLVDDPFIQGIVVYTHDITERKEYERQLEDQRARLAALNQLNGVVNRVTEAVIEQSMREEIEQIACQRLVESDRYEFAWIGEVRSTNGTIATRAEAGVDGFFADCSLSADAEPEEAGPVERAIQSGEIQSARGISTAQGDESWQAVAEEYGFESCAAIPIHHQDTIYGVLSVYAARGDAFSHEERTVLGHLGEIIGHAIAAAERKKALMSDSLVELEIGVPDVFESVDDSPIVDERIDIGRVVPVTEETFLVYGTTSERAAEEFESLLDRVPYWEELNVLNEHDGEVRFEVRLSQPPVLSAIAAHGGSIEEAVIDGGDYHLVVHLPQGADVRGVIDTIRETFPEADALARRQITDAGVSSERLTDAWMEDLTDRQRTAIEVAHYSGFFEWPRGSSGEEVAESLDVSSPTFHQHVRAAERKLFDALLEDSPPAGSALEDSSDT